MSSLKAFISSNIQVLIFINTFYSSTFFILKINKTGFYDTADVGFKCEKGFVTVLSRADDVINVAGHRLSSSAIEEAILEHDELSDCAVVGLHDELKGVVPFGFLVKTKSEFRKIY